MKVEVKYTNNYLQIKNPLSRYDNIWMSLRWFDNKDAYHICDDSFIGRFVELDVPEDEILEIEGCSLKSTRLIPEIMCEGILAFDFKFMKWGTKESLLMARKKNLWNKDSHKHYKSKEKIYFMEGIEEGKQRKKRKRSSVNEDYKVKNNTKEKKMETEERIDSLMEESEEPKGQIQIGSVINDGRGDCFVCGFTKRNLPLIWREGWGKAYRAQKTFKLISVNSEQSEEILKEKIK